MKTCPSCKKPVSPKAESCPNCGHPIKKKTSGCAVLFLFGILFLFIFATIGGTGSTSSPSEPDPHSDAIVMAQQFVEQNLKSPDSAKFPWSFEEFTVHELESGGYEVHGYVDSQNSFGAMIRSRFIVQLKSLGNDQWQLLDLQID